MDGRRRKPGDGGSRFKIIGENGPWRGALLRLQFTGCTKNEGKKKMNAETSKSGKTIWAFDLGKGSIGDPLRRRDSAARAVRCGDKFLHKASLLIPAEFAEKKKGLIACASAPRKCARVVGELISWALRPTRLTATIQVLICEQE
jgi:hypothetical protein